MRVTILTGASMALALTLSSSAGASELFATTYDGVTSDLYSVNQSTGAISLVGGTGVDFGDLTSTNSQLIGVDLTNNALWTINPATGAASNEVSISGTQGVSPRLRGIRSRTRSTATPPLDSAGRTSSTPSMRRLAPLRSSAPSAFPTSMR
jgi:hypothetical protein